MSRPTLSARAKLAWLGLLAVAGFVALLVPVAIGQQGGESGGTPLKDDDATCLSCHDGSMPDCPKANAAALKQSPHKDFTCQSCHSSITAFPHTEAMKKQKTTCGDCHADQATAFLKSVHAHADKVAGDHPTCITCHGAGDPHGVKAPAAWTRKDKAKLCADCHSNKTRMARYGVDVDAVSSFEDSFHGKALLHFGKMNAATCVDCHHAHDVMPSTNPESSTHSSHIAAACSQKGCHPGAKLNFAASGVTHVKLVAKSVPGLHWEELFFRVLTIGTVAMLLLGITLDLRVKVFRRGAKPAAGQTVGIFISMSFLMLVFSILMAFLGAPGVPWGLLASLIIMALALVIYLAGPKKPAHGKGQKRYHRFSLAQRAQHLCLAISFTVLVLTGLPLRFASVTWLHHLQVLFGGFEGARLAHRIAAVVMIVTWVWHTLYLLYRWAKAGFTLKSWTMFPAIKDFADFAGVVKYYLGLAPEEPKYDRFQFREKFDYFAVYWGMPIMVFSGLMLWWPVYFGNMFPRYGLSIAYIAHSDEAILAFLAIVTWHFYNTHFNPDHFPMSDVFYTGTMSEEHMKREHPLELERVEKQEPSAE